MLKKYYVLNLDNIKLLYLYLSAQNIDRNEKINFITIIYRF